MAHLSTTEHHAVAAVANGVNLIDTARGYGLSEERIGRHLAHRRQDFLLSTKVGYGVEGLPDWTYDCIVGGVERALRDAQPSLLGEVGHVDA